MRLRKLLTFPPWLSLIAGIILGGVLTSTFTFRLWWCSYDDLSIDRETLSIIKVNERFWARRNADSLGEAQWTQGPPSKDDCACGQELEELRRLAALLDKDGRSSPKGSTEPSLDLSPKVSTSLVPKPTEKTFVIPSLKYNGSESLSSYFHPQSDHDGTEQPNEQIQYLSYEYNVKRELLVAVVTSESQLERASAIYNTWGTEVSQVIFFVGEDCNISHPAAVGLPIVRLIGIEDSLDHSVEKTFAVFQYLYENYADSFHWYMPVGDAIYVRGEQLRDSLRRLDPSDHIYLGRAIAQSKDDWEKLELAPHESYCMGGPGYVLSSRTLRALGEKLSYCLAAVEQHNSEGVGESWDTDHVEVGRCLSRTIGLQCSQSVEASAYFTHRLSTTITRSQLILKSLESQPNLLTFHPVPDAATMTVIHHFYKTAEFKTALERTRYLESQVNEMCAEIEAMTDKPKTPTCKVYYCPCEEHISVSQRCPSAGVISSPARSYAATSRNDYQSWDYFDSTNLYMDMQPSPSYYLHVHKNRRHELQLILGKVVQAASEQYGRNLKFKKVINGYIRHNPMRGNEYIIDVEFADPRDHWKPVTTRVSIVKPLASNYLTLPDNNNVATPVNFIVPITKVNERFAEFMHMFDTMYLQPNLKVNLVLSVYGKEDVAFVNDALKSYRAKYPEASLVVVEGQGTFSRGKALNLGLSKLHPEDLAFLCDVDMEVGPSFLSRCRKNAIRGSRVYYPEFFKLYNLDYVYSKGSRPSLINIKRSHGHWAYYSFGMLCIYKSDYDAAGGMNTNIIGWGEEDVNFFEKVLRKKLDVLRAPDTSLKHRWHEKSCPKSLVGKQYYHCLSSRGENLADRIELATYIYQKGYQLTDKPPKTMAAIAGNATNTLIEGL